VPVQWTGGLSGRAGDHTSNSSEPPKSESVVPTIGAVHTVIRHVRTGLVLALRLFLGPGDEAAAVIYETKRSLTHR